MYNFSIYVTVDSKEIPFLCQAQTLTSALSKAQTCLGLSSAPTDYSVKYIQEVKA